MAKKNKKSTGKNTSKKSYVWTFWKVFAGMVIFGMLLFMSFGWGLWGELPDHTELENPESDMATEIISLDGKTLGKIFRANHNRTPIKYRDLPQNLVNALVATEDERFYEHSGIDAKGTLRAVVYMGSRGGASTITQQLAKLFFTDNYNTSTAERIIQKIKEWHIAVRLEKQYTKEEIITMYLNEFDFLFGANGIRSASNIYFGKEPKDLKVEESAVLVAMLKNPRQYNPNREISKDKSLARRNQVLYQMYRNEMLTEEEKDSLTALPIKLDFTPEGHNDGQGTYFRQYVRKWLKDWIKENPNPETGEEYDIYGDGLKVYVTLDSRMQQYAEDAVTAHMKNLQGAFDRKNKNNKTAPFRDLTKTEIEQTMMAAIKRSERWREMRAKDFSEDKILKSFEKPTDMTVFTWEGERDTVMTPRDSILHYKKYLQAGMMSMEPETGYVKAWVGGINHKHFKYDHVKKGKRQVGSTFKPFVYSTAIELKHYSPCKIVPNVQYTIPAGKYGNMKDWSPKNSDEEYGNLVSLSEALANSLNTISARLMDEVGPQPIIDMATRLGVDTERMRPLPALALGTEDVSVYDMVGAYAVFANGGIYTEPTIITRIEDKNGTALYQHTPKTKDVLSEETAYTTVKLLEGVTRAGSGRRLRGKWAVNNSLYKEVVTGYPYDFENDIAGKTGTTQNQSDGWFMGMVPDLVTGVWVGGEDRSIHFPTITYGQGATMALPIWGSYMKSLYNDPEIDVSKEPFKKPEDLTIEVDCEKYNAENTGDELEDEGMDREGDEAADELELL